MQQSSDEWTSCPFCLLSPMWKCTHAQLPLICLSASLISHLFNVCLLGGNRVILLQCQNVTHSLLSFYPHKHTSSCLGKHDITSKQSLAKKNAWDPLKMCSVTHTHTHTKRWRSSVFFYNRQQLLACEPWDNWFCLQAVNHFFHPTVAYYNAVTLTCCKHMKWREVLSHQLITCGPTLHYALICTYSMSEVLHWLLAFIATEDSSSHLNFLKCIFLVFWPVLMQ